MLFLDELPEFDRRVLEALARAAGDGLYRGVTRVVADAVPGGVSADHRDESVSLRISRRSRAARCRCPPAASSGIGIAISGPLLDRIDLRIEVPALEARELASLGEEGESSAQVAARVIEARARAMHRAGKLNSRLSVKEVGEYCRLDPAASLLLWQSYAHWPSPPAAITGCCASRERSPISTRATRSASRTSRRRFR